MYASCGLVCSGPSMGILRRALRSVESGQLEVSIKPTLRGYVGI